MDEQTLEEFQLFCIDILIDNVDIIPEYYQSKSNPATKYAKALSAIIAQISAYKNNNKDWS